MKLRNRILVSSDDDYIYNIRKYYGDHAKDLLILCGIIATIIIALILTQIPYYEITIVGNNIYSKIAAYISKLNNKSYIYCASTKQYLICHTDRNNFKSFHQPLQEELFQEKTFGNLSQEELNLVSNHIGRDLNTSYIDIMSRLTSPQDILKENPQSGTFQILSCGMFNTVTNGYKTWITKRIIVDHTGPLHINDKIVSINENNELCTRYNVTIDGIIETEETEKESIVYSLDTARCFNYHNTCYFHPFHIPATKNPILALITIANTW